MSDLDRDFSERSIDHNHKMEKFKEGEFSGWDNLKYPLLAAAAVLLVIGGVVMFIAGAWGSL